MNVPSHNFDDEYQIQLKDIKATASTKQIDKFKDLARELETDESEERFDERLRKVAKSPPPKDGKPGKDKPAK